jgi:ubiquitin carboxyl-terminal hydrolase 8
LLEKIRIQLVENDALASGQHDDASVQEVMSKYPPVDVLDSLPSSPYSDGGSLLDDLPSVPKHMPQKARSSPQTPQTPQTPPAATTTTTTAAPPQGYMKMPEPLANIPPLPQQPQQQSLGIQLPTPSNFPLPPMNIIDPSQLASWIAKRQNTPQPSVLILDVRPRQAFDQGFIKHRWVAQIEPLVLKRE